MEPRYQPFFCEENAWQLARTLLDGQGWVVFVSNPAAQVAFWSQRAGPLSGPIVWDFHVMFVHRPEGAKAETHVHDPDCRLASPLPALTWLQRSFPVPSQVKAQYQPRFRVVAREDFVANFVSDRSHMRDAHGWTQPPPSWPAPGPGMNLMQFVDMASEFHGEVFDLEGFRTWLLSLSI